MLTFISFSKKYSHWHSHLALGYIQMHQIDVRCIASFAFFLFFFYQEVHHNGNFDTIKGLVFHNIQKYDSYHSRKFASVIGVEPGTWLNCWSTFHSVNCGYPLQLTSDNLIFPQHTQALRKGLVATWTHFLVLNFYCKVIIYFIWQSHRSFPLHILIVSLHSKCCSAELLLRAMLMQIVDAWTPDKST